MADKVRLKGLLAKVESVYKTDSVPVIGTDGVQLEDNLWNQIEWGFLEDNLRENMAQKGFGRAGLEQPEGRFIHITAVVAFKGTVAALATGNRPEWDILMQICGHAADYVTTPGEGAYTPITNSIPSASIYAYSSGGLFKAVGCRGTVSIAIIAGQLIRMTFDIYGVLVSEPTDAAQPTIVYAQKALQPPNAKSSAFTLNGYSPAGWHSATLANGAVLAERMRGGDPDIHAGYEIMDWDPKLDVSIDRPVYASFNPKTLAKAGTLFVTTFTLGSVQYNKMQVTASKCRLLAGPHSEDKGFPMEDLKMRLQNTDAETPDTAYTIRIF